MENVKKLKYVVAFRRFTDEIIEIILKVPLPQIHPDVISALSLILSVFFVFYNNVLYQILILAIVLILDWLDGLVAKKYQYRKSEIEKERGWMVDVFTDRLSEGIISIIYFMPFFPLFSLNCFLSLWSYKSKKHFILPVRQVLFLYLVIKIFINL